MTVIGIGSVVQKDDGFGVYASTYLKENYTFSKELKIINGGVEGINLYSVCEESSDILILDAIKIEDTPASIYLIPSHELSAQGLNSGGAHEIGVLQCIDMLELQDKTLPKTTVLGIVPHHITYEMDLSQTLKEAFNDYINIALNFLKEEGFVATKKSTILTLEEIIFSVRRI